MYWKKLSCPQINLKMRIKGELTYIRSDSLYIVLFESDVYHGQGLECHDIAKPAPAPRPLCRRRLVGSSFVCPGLMVVPVYGQPWSREL